SRLVDNIISHDTITRFLAEEIKTSADLWKIAANSTFDFFRNKMSETSLQNPSSGFFYTCISYFYEKKAEIADTVIV
ncbi:MAG: hypothetical protein JW795_16215, partial [Chitinivibrionales bacterium]|nr:hypothetical protein [Chitinivibrionales bacterium]